MVGLRYVALNRVYGILGIAVALCNLSSRAWATYRADFFDTSHRPTVAFDKTHLTWTLRNQSVERIVHFDAARGGLQTLELRDLHTHHALHMAPGGEGEISFASALLQVPSPLPDWRVATTDPGPAWMAPNFNDRAWKIVNKEAVNREAANKQTVDAQSLDKTDAMPKTRADSSTPHWYRAAIPANRLKAGHAYALYLPAGIPDEAEIYCDGALAQKFPTDFSTQGRPEQIDLPVNCQSLAIKISGASPLPAYISEVGTSPVTLALNENWAYTHHALNVGEDNSQILTIHLSGTKQYEGFEIDVSYQIYAGEEPTVAKWFTFISHRKSRFLIDTAILDRWRLPDNWEKVKVAPRPRQLFIRADSLTGDLLMTGQVGRSALPLDSPDGKTLIPNADIQRWVAPNTPIQSPRSLTAFWHGPEGVAAFLHQLYYGQYVVEGTPTSIPIAYDTRYTYRDLIDANICNRIVPLAAAIGSQAFVLDDGWQSNGKPGTGRFGDWQTDKTRFPKGILPVSTLVRLNHLRFGLWVDLNRVDPQSQAATQHPDWLYSALPNGQGEEESQLSQICFTGVWAHQFLQSVVELSRATSLTYIKTRFHLGERCMSTGHDHPVGRSGAAEEEARTALHEAVLKTAPGVVEVDDPLPALFWQRDPFVSAKQQKVLGWLDLADLLVPGSHEQAFRQGSENSDPLLTPSFTLIGEAFCHLPTEDHPTRDQLDFLWSYVAASTPGFEIQGDLERMTEIEREAARRWISWADGNREWLAFTQSVTIATDTKGKTEGKAEGKRGRGGRITEKAEQVTGHKVRGLLHLRNALQGRYGYLCLWNQNPDEQKVVVSFRPADYFVHIRPGGLDLVDIEDPKEGAKPIPFTQHAGVCQLGAITLPPYGHMILELKTK